METFIETIKIILEKRLLPAMISLVIGILGFAFTPESFILLARLGREWYILLLVASAFVLIAFLQFIYRKISDAIVKSSNRKISKELEEKAATEKLHEVWDYIDSLTVEDRLFIEQFLKNGNKPVKENNYYSMINSIKDDEYNVKSREVATGNTVMKEYKLSEDFYGILMYSKQKYGRIGNFEDKRVDILEDIVR